MFFHNIKRKMIGCVVASVLLLSAGVYVSAAYIPTARDTLPAPDKAEYQISDTSEYEKLYESNTYIYWYKEDRDIIAIENKKTGYVMKTGIDVPFSSAIENEAIMADTYEEKLEIAGYIEDSMNDTYTGIANSLVTVEYREPDAPDTVKNISSAGKKGASSKLMTLNDNPATRRLDVRMTGIDLNFSVYITFGEDTITYRIPYEEITGDGKKCMVSINISPFFGASGGKILRLNEETEMYDLLEEKYMVPGYIFIPDGSGSLIRFQDNNMAFTEYIGTVYGKDLAADEYYNSMLGDAVPLYEPTMPVFGIAHGDKQAAFVAYATKGDEYMEIIARPEGNKSTNYNWVYPRFTYNDIYYQVYNKKGDGFFTLNDVVNEYDAEITYQLLSGDGTDGGYVADYTGMAQAYRDYLIESGVLKEREYTWENIPIRVDFMMSDVKNSVIGTKSVTATTVEDVRMILDDIISHRIENINSGLYGWQKGGMTLAKPYEAKYNRNLGSKSDFADLMKEYKKLGIDISVVQDYVEINREMMNYYKNASKHINSWYVEEDRSWILDHNVPVYQFGYAVPKRAASWLEKQAERFEGISDSMTIEGISHILTSHWDDENSITRSEAKELYQKTVGEVSEKSAVNMDAPNQYLWGYLDRYLNAPVGHSQMVFETDSVPFLEMVLYGTMETYAPYANFSFYAKKDILKMIDYNLYPSFILTEAPSYELRSTDSSYLYSTEYELYQDVIPEVYHEVNSVLSQVKGYAWTGREVVEAGVIRNTYTREKDMIQVLINYTDGTVEVPCVNQTIAVDALSVRVVR